MTDLLALISQRLAEVATEAGRRAAEFETARALPRDVVDAVVHSGIFRLSVPERHGGLGAGLGPILRAVDRTATRDGSLGWFVLNGLIAGLDAARLPPDHARSIHGEPTALVLGDRSIGGTAVAQPDGSLLVTGRWSWGTGASHSTWLGGRVRVVDTEGASSQLLDGTTELHAYLRRDQVVVLDTWHAHGLRGAGATDYVATDAVVPEGRWVSHQVPPHVVAPLYTLDPAEVFALGAAAAAVGIASRAVGELIATVTTGPEAGADGPVGRRRAEVAGAAARAQATVRAVRADLRGLAARVDETEPARPIDGATARDVVSAAISGVQWSADAVRHCYRAGGAGAIQHASPLQRLLRDVEVIAQHPSVAVGRYEDIGAGLLAER